MHTDHPGRLAMPTVRALSPYVPGKPISELERELGIRQIVKLASNENPCGPSPRVIEAVRAEVADVGLYPDGSGFELKRALAAHLGVPETHLTLGNGSNELLLLLAECFLGPAHSAIYSQYGFAIYPNVIQATGAQAIVTPAYTPGSVMPLGHDLGAMSAALRADTRLVFIANPNNPTGTWVEPAKLRAFIAAAPADTIIVIDEAYLEYGRRDACIDAICCARSRKPMGWPGCAWATRFRTRRWPMCSTACARPSTSARWRSPARASRSPSRPTWNPASACV
jgi:histidinol-phosphate aminotransferase